MPGATLSDPGLTTWTDNTHNWRAADADYLQRRGIMRFASAGTRTTALTATPVAGLVTYNATTQNVEFTDAASATANVWRTILAPKYMTISDSVASVGMKLASDASAVVALEASKVVLGPSRIVTIDATGFRLTTGAATAALTTDAVALVSDKLIKAPGATLSAALTGTTSTMSGGVSAASVSASGDVAAATLHVSSTSYMATVQGGASSWTTVYGSSTIQSATLLTAPQVNGGQLSMWSIYIQNQGGGGAYMYLQQSVGLVAGAGGSIALIPANNDPVRWGSTSGPYIACVVASASDPGAGNYPEGTIWFQV